MRLPAVSIVLLLEKIASKMDASSSSGTLRLIKRCKARSPGSRRRGCPGVGEGGAASSIRIRSSLRDELSTVAYIERVVDEEWCTEVSKQRTAMEAGAGVSVSLGLSTCFLFSLTRWAPSGPSSP